MVVLKPHQRPPVDMFDIFSAMDYMRRKYNATVEISFDNCSNDAGYGLLCLTVVAKCGNGNHPPVGIGWLAEPTADMLRRMPEVLQDALLSVLEDIDGGCAACKLKASGID